MHICVLLRLWIRWPSSWLNNSVWSAVSMIYILAHANKFTKRDQRSQQKAQRLGLTLFTWVLALSRYLTYNLLRKWRSAVTEILIPKGWHSLLPRQQKAGLSQTLLSRALEMSEVRHRHCCQTRIGSGGWTTTYKRRKYKVESWCLVSFLLMYCFVSAFFIIVKSLRATPWRE